MRSKDRGSIRSPDARTDLGALVLATLTTALAAAWQPPVTAAEPEWLALRTERFGLVSQLDEDATRRWAVEFDQFIDALHQLHRISEQDLAPLTIVLFKGAREFAPYRNTTQSGQANVAGFFGNMGTWSTIGLPGRSSSATTRHTIYHEAVHWFASADEVEAPLWFEEGLAEVYSTFAVEDDKGRWGLPIKESVEYLNYVGLQPLDELMRLTQDETLHGSQRFYPEAWAFTHYMMFGNNGAERPKLVKLLERQRETDLETAFMDAFGAPPDEMTTRLRRYLAGGSYGVAEMPVRDRGAEMEVVEATPAQVQFALARLAIAGSNDELAAKHIDRVIELVPQNPEPYGLRAILARRANDEAALDSAVATAIERGSKEPEVYTIRGARLVEQHRREGAPITEMLPADVAREVADMLERSLTLRPHNRRVYEALVPALLNVAEAKPEDDAVLSMGRRIFPTNGLVLVGAAALAKQRGDVPSAAKLLRSARAEPFTLPTGFRPVASSLHDTWIIEWLGAELQTLMPDGKFADAKALLDAELAEDALSGRARKAVAEMRGAVDGFERMRAAAELGLDGNDAEARAELRAIAGDEGLPERVRREAQRMLDSLPPSR